jgi:BirA family biotin operon repressor/biotin-[acetyl-CoA-carboxylase] ligase
VSAPRWRIEIAEEVPSTQTLVAARAEAGEEAGLALLARRQSAGRGREGRAWRSPEGNLHLSVLLRPAAPARALPQLALLAAVALHDAARPRAPVRLKWPNDLMLGEAKAAGILAEAALDAAGVVRHLVLGIGANLAAAPPLPDRATAALGPEPPEDFARRLLVSLAAWLDRHAAEGFAPVRAAWMAAGPPPGAPLALRRGDRRIEGRYQGLAEDGALRLEVGGRVLDLHAGELEGN